MARYAHHVFTCINERDECDARGSCARAGGNELAAWFKAEGKARDFRGRIRMNKAGCLDACELGPVVVIYPEQVWYCPRTQDDVRRICEEHLEGGRVVEDLLAPGLN